MWNNLYKERMEKDISTRLYYMKFIFNSHFLIFLTIALGAFLYTLFGLKETLQGNIYIDIIVSILLAVSITPTYRNLLKEADIIFLAPVQQKLKGYFKQSYNYSLMLSFLFPVGMTVLTFMLVLINHSPLEMVSFYIVFIVVILLTYHLKVKLVNTLLNEQAIIYIMMIVNASLLWLVLQNFLFIILIPVIYSFIFLFIKNKQKLSVDWLEQINHEVREENRFYTIMSMFTNVRKVDKSFKRRRYLDVMMKKMNIKHYNKKHMYDYMFHRSFLRDHDLPMILLRLILLFGIFIIWMSNIYVTIIFSMFVLYIMILQLTQIYSAQAYLLWPKIWPVSRKNIQASYIRYSHKVVLFLSIIFMILFVMLHTNLFYLAFIFPIWGYVLNQLFSKNVYKKEEALSD